MSKVKLTKDAGVAKGEGLPDVELTLTLRYRINGGSATLTHFSNIKELSGCGGFTSENLAKYYARLIDEQLQHNKLPEGHYLWLLDEEVLFLINEMEPVEESLDVEVL